MKALEILKAITENEGTHLWLDDGSGYPKSYIYEAIKELEAYITNYQGIKRRLDNTVITLAVLQNGNKALVKTLEKMNEEMIDLRKENQDLKEGNKELIEYLKSTQKRLEEWLEKCK